MNYIVAGWPRSATSSMMAALAAGGIPLYYCAERERVLRERFPAQAGFFKPSAAQVRSTLFPADHAIKLLKDGPCKLQQGDYKVIFMRRDGEECRQSAQALFNRPLGPEWAQMVERETARIVGILKQRRDMAVIEVPYREVVSDPQDWFWRIADEGWPIDPPLAASHVDPAKLRYRREDLQVGA